MAPDQIPKTRLRLAAHHLAGIFCLGSGALLRAAHGKWGTSEARLFALLRRTLRRDDILVGDRRGGGGE